MKATEAKLLDFLRRSPQFVIPVYQRTYSWKERECRQLWDDILRTGLERPAAGGIEAGGRVALRHRISSARGTRWKAFSP